MNKTLWAKTTAEIKQKYPTIIVKNHDCCIVLQGQLPSWDDIVNVGYIATKAKSEGVVNEIKLAGHVDAAMRISPINDKKYDGYKCDVLIIGGGIIGTAILREFTKYNIKVCLIEKENDVAIHASSRNDGCIHVGVDLSQKSQKHKYLRRAVKIYESLAHDLDVDFIRHGQTLVFTNKMMRLAMPFFLKSCRKKGLLGTHIIKREELLKIEPNLNKNAQFAVHFPEGAIISPYNMVVALAENAIDNGGSVFLNTAALSFQMDGQKIVSVLTNRGTIYPQVVINAAGVFSDVIAKMANDQFFTIHPRRGVEIVLDKKASDKSVHSTLSFYFGRKDKKAHTKGGGIIPTVDGNVVVGPTASEFPEREDYSTTNHEIDLLFEKHRQTLPTLNRSDVITYFAGIRAATYEEDFIVRQGKWTKNIIHAAGIQSPGLTAAPAIAEDIVKIYQEVVGQKLSPNPRFNPIRKSQVHLKNLDIENRNRIILANPDYGQIVCRCEEISKGEIIEALHRPLEVNTIDAIKRRVRAGMGRCQGGFCQQLVLQIIAQEKGIPLSKVVKKGEGHVLLQQEEERL